MIVARLMAQNELSPLSAALGRFTLIARSGEAFDS